MKRVHVLFSVIAALSIALFLAACQQPAAPSTDDVPSENGPASTEAEVTPTSKTVSPTATEAVASPTSEAANPTATEAVASPTSEAANSGTNDAGGSDAQEAALSLEDKIANAMSAAPSPIAQEATILGFPEEWPGNWPDEPAPELVELRAGSNGWTCIIDRPDTPGNDPMCLNETMLENVMAQRRLEDGPSTGIGIGYMLQGGGPVGSPPHVMIFTPESNASHAAFTMDPGPQPWVMFPDTSYQHLMVLLPPAGEAVTAVEDTIANAMSAAPPPISQDATILGFPEEWPGNWPDEPAPEMVELRAGSNGWTCIIDRPDTPGNDPMCLNETFLDLIVAQRRLADSPTTGIGFGYMLQGGGPVGSPPHIMVFAPESNAGLAAFTTEPGPQPWVMFSETPNQHLMILGH